VILAFLVSLVVNVLRATGRELAYARPVSFTAAGLLLLQYVLGFGLLGGDYSITAWHYLIALAAIIPVGAEHMMANNEADARVAGRNAAIANLATLVLVVIAYTIGQSHS
jgi:hypothetical protein